MTYLLDSDIFIQAKNLHYGFDICPGFWDWLEQAHGAGLVHSVEKVGQELQAGGDNLSTWAAAHQSFFVVPDQAVLNRLRALAAWATGNYEQAGVATFLAAADSYLVAHAAAHGLTVVTAEVASNSTKKIKIPNACAGAGVTHCTLYDALRAEGVQFVLP